MLSPARRASRRAAAARRPGVGAGVGDRAPQLADQPRQRQRSLRAALDLLDPEPELGQEAGRLLAVVLGGGDRGDDEARAGARARDVEEPALLLEQLARGQRRDQLGPALAVGADPVGLEHGRAPAEVRPAVLLDVGHDHQVPLEALGPVGGQQAHGGAPDALLGQGVGRDLLGHQPGEEVTDTGGAGDRGDVALLGLAGGHVEEGHDRVEVAVCASRRAGAELDAATQPARPVGAGPQRPQGVLGRAALGQAVGRRPDEGVQRAGCGGLRAGDVVEEAVAEHCQADQLPGGRRQPGLGVRGVLLASTQVPGQAAHVAGVEATERPEQQGLGAGVVDVVGRLLVVVVDVDRGAQRIEKRQHRRVLHERQLVARHLDRDAGRAESAAERRDAGAARADQHRHPVPGDAVLEVCAAEQVGEVLGLGALGVEGQHACQPFVRGLRGDRAQERLTGGQVDRAGEADARGDALGGHQQPRAEAACGPQRHDRRRRTVGPREVRRELEDAAHLRPPETVDRLVRVTHDDKVAAVAGERAQQGDLAGVGVLVLVDEHVPELPAQVVAMGRRLDDGAPDQVGVVGRGLVVEVDEVALEEQPGGDVRREPGRLAERDQLVGLQSLLPRAGQHHLDLAREAARLQGPVELLGPRHRLRRAPQQLADDDVLLRRGQQPEGRAVELAGGVPADQPVGERVDGRADRRAGRATQPRGDPVAELLGGLAREGQRQHLRRVRAAVLDAVDDRLDQRRGLAGARPGEHEQRAALVVDDALLVVVEHGRQRRRAVAHQAVGGPRAHGAHLAIGGRQGRRGDGVWSQTPTKRGPGLAFVPNGVRFEGH